MKKTRQYTCTRRVNKEGRKIWVVLENDKKFYRIFKTQSLAIAYFKPLKTGAQMMVQQADGNKFTKIVYTIEEMSKRGMKTASKTIEHQVVIDSDKFFDETKLKSKTPEPKKPKKVVPKPEPIVIVEPEPIVIVEPEPIVIVEPAPVVIVKPAPVVIVEPAPVVIVEPAPRVIVVKAEPIVKEIYVDKIVKIDSNTGEIITDEELASLLKTIEDNKIINKSLEKDSDLFWELEQLDEARISEFEKQDMLNTSIIDEILNRKSVVENSWTEEIVTYTEENFDNTDTIENTIYVKDKVQKPIVINSQKIIFSDDSTVKETSTIESIIDNKTENSNTKSVDYGRIKEYTDYEKTQIQNFQNDSSIKEDFSAKILKTVDKDKRNNMKFWLLTVILSILIMLLMATIVLWFVPIENLK